MATPIEQSLNDLVENRGLTVDAGDLRGALKVVDRDALFDLVRNLVAAAEGEARSSSAGGSGISKMLDEYLRQNADLRQKESSARRKTQEAEFELKAAQARIRELESSPGAGAAAPAADAAALEPFLRFDPAEGTALFEQIEQEVSSLETTLNEIKDDEGAWAFVSRVGEMRADFNALREEFQKAVSAFEAAVGPFRAGSGAPSGVPALVEAVCETRGKISEARLTKKSLDFFQSMIQSE
jgi:hypothetical protein